MKKGTDHSKLGGSSFLLKAHEKKKKVFSRFAVNIQKIYIFMLKGINEKREDGSYYGSEDQSFTGAVANYI